MNITDRYIQVELCEDCVLVCNGYDLDDEGRDQTVTERLEANWPSDRWELVTCTGPMNDPDDIGKWVIRHETDELWWDDEGDDWDSFVWATRYDSPPPAVSGGIPTLIEVVNRDYECEGGFSWHSCDGCGNTEGGMRHTSLAVRRDEETTGRSDQ